MQVSIDGFVAEFAEIWNSTPKVVFSSSLAEIGPRARLVGTDDLDRELERLKDEVTGILDIGGPTLAAAAIRLGLIEEYRLFVQPAALGAGTPYFPPGQARVNLDLVETRRFGSGVVYLAYRPR
jgi:dihydrofolate reductase